MRPVGPRPPQGRRRGDVPRCSEHADDVQGVSLASIAPRSVGRTGMCFIRTRAVILVLGALAVACAASSTASSRSPPSRHGLSWTRWSTAAAAVASSTTASTLPSATTPTASTATSTAPSVQTTARRLRGLDRKSKARMSRVFDTRRFGAQAEGDTSPPRMTLVGAADPTQQEEAADLRGEAAAAGAIRLSEIESFLNRHETVNMTSTSHGNHASGTNIANFESRLISAENISEFLKSFLRNGSHSDEHNNIVHSSTAASTSEMGTIILPREEAVFTSSPSTDANPSSRAHLIGRALFPADMVQEFLATVSPVVRTTKKYSEGKMEGVATLPDAGVFNSLTDVQSVPEYGLGSFTPRRTVVEHNHSPAAGPPTTHITSSKFPPWDTTFKDEQSHPDSLTTNVKKNTPLEETIPGKTGAYKISPMSGILEMTTPYKTLPIEETMQQQTGIDKYGASSESIKPDRKAIVITFQKLKGSLETALQKGTAKQFRDSGTEDHHPRHEQNIVSTTSPSSFFVSHTMVAQSDEALKKDGAFYLNAVPSTYYSTQAAQTPDVTTVESKQRISASPIRHSTMAPVDTIKSTEMQKSNQNSILLALYVSTRNGTHPFINDTISIHLEKNPNYSANDPNLSNHPKSGLKTLYEMIMQMLTQISGLQIVSRDFVVDLQVPSGENGASSTYRTPFARSENSPTIARSGTEEKIPSTLLSPNLKLPIAADHIQSISNITDVPTEEPVEKEVMDNIVLYAESADCTPEVVKKISELEEHWKDGTKLVIEMICRPHTNHNTSGPDGIDHVSEVKNSALQVVPSVSQGSRGKKPTTVVPYFETRMHPTVKKPSHSDTSAEDSQDFPLIDGETYSEWSNSLQFHSVLTSTDQGIKNTDDDLDIESRLDGRRIEQLSATMLSNSDQLENDNDPPEQRKRSQDADKIPRLTTSKKSKVHTAPRFLPDKHSVLHAPEKSHDIPKKISLHSHAKTTKPVQENDDRYEKVFRMTKGIDDSPITSIEIERATIPSSEGRKRRTTPFTKRTAERAVTVQESIGHLDLEAIERIEKSELEVESETPDSASVSRSATTTTPLTLWGTTFKPEVKTKPLETSSDSSNLFKPVEVFGLRNSTATTTRKNSWRLLNFLSMLEEMQFLATGNSPTTDSSTTISKLHVDDDVFPSKISAKSDGAPANFHPPGNTSSISSNDGSASKNPLLESNDNTQNTTTVSLSNTTVVKAAVNPEVTAKDLPTRSVMVTNYASGVTETNASTEIIATRLAQAITDTPLPILTSLPPEVTSGKTTTSPVTRNEIKVVQPKVLIRFVSESTPVTVVKLSRPSYFEEVESNQRLDSCENLCKPKFRAVCAMVGMVTRTYSSLCAVKTEGCVVGVIARILHTGPCDKYRKRKTKVIIEQEDVFLDGQRDEEMSLSNAVENSTVANYNTPPTNSTDNSSFTKTAGNESKLGEI